jgi:ABC-type uncharacterized transport system permease subunit
MTGFFPYLLAFLSYSALGLYFWRATWRGTKPAEGGEARATTWERAAIPVPLLLHGWLLYQSLFTPAGVNLGVGEAVSAIAWLTVLIYWLGSFRYNLAGLQTLVLPGAAVLLLLPVFLPETHPLPHTEFAAFRSHLMISMLAYALFTIAALHALLMAVAERSLHHRSMSQIMQNLPPLLTMEQLLFRIIAAGFVLLTLTILSGIMFSEELFGKPLQFNHKTVFAIVSWGIYAILLGGRQIYGWRGRIAIRWTLAGFAALILAYLGSKFVLEVILHR